MKSEQIEKGEEIKKIVIFLLTILMIAVSILHAENDEWGAWFKENVRISNKTREQFPPENKSIIQHNWKYKKTQLIDNYKEFIEQHKGEKLTKGDYPDNILGILSYYYDESDPEIDQIVDFFIYVFENDSVESIKIDAIKNITTIALEGNTKVENYISTQADNSSLSHKIRLQLNLSNITIKDDKQSLNYLMNLIKNSQDIETTNLKFKSPDEGTILWYLSRNFFVQRYNKGLEYEYALPLMKQILLSRSKGVQDLVAMIYLSLTNKAEMRSIYNDCWAKVQDKNTPREEYIDALYGLQALYELRDGKHAMEFKGISSYFARLGGLTLINDEWEYTEAEGETRLNKEEKHYFQKRLRSK